MKNKFTCPVRNTDESRVRTEIMKMKNNMKKELVESDKISNEMPQKITNAFSVSQVNDGGNEKNQTATEHSNILKNVGMSVNTPPGWRVY